MERIKFSAIVNSIWGLNIYPEPILLPQAGGNEQPQEGQDNTQAQEGTNND